MDKPNDMFAVLFYQPEASVSELALNGITPDNTGIQDKDYYKNMKSVQEAPQFQTEGKFDETKFNNFYDSVNRVYNTYATEDWQKQLMSNFAKDPLDWTEPFNNNVKEFSVTIDNSNRSRTQMGISGFNKTGDPTLSMREIAQANKMRDKDGNILDFSPNSRGFFASIFAPTAVLAQYDETGMYEENGQQVMHYKGEYKLDDMGDPYYEELGDRPVYGKEVLRLSDVFTTDGTTMNKYFDLLDADGVDQSVAKTIMKTAAWVAPLFVPVVGKAYGVIGALSGLATSIPGMLNSINSAFGINDTGYGRAISAADAYMDRFKETTSDYSQGKFFTVENMGNLITSSASQLFSQRTVANVSQMLLAGGEDFAKSRALGQKLSLGYMALTSSTDAYNDFKAAGASDTIAGIGALASMGALYGLMSKDYFKDMLFKGQWLDENDAKSVVKRLYKEKSEEYTKAVLGLTEAEITAAETTQQGAKSLFGKLKDKSSKIWNKFVNSAFSGKAPDPTVATNAAAEAVEQTAKEAGQEAAKETMKASFGKRALSIFGTMLNRSVNEGVEETMEDVVGDMVKGLASAGDMLGLNWHDEKVDEINFEWNLGDALTKYATSFIGGFFGGAVFEGISQLEYARDHTMRLGDLGDVDSQMLYLLMQGRKQDLLDYAKLYHDKNGFLSRDLSMKEIQRTEDGKLIYAPASGKEKSQNDQMYDFLVADINHLDTLLQNNGFTLGALAKYMSEYDKNADQYEKNAQLNTIAALKKLKVHTTMMDDMIDVAKKLIAVNEQIDDLDRWMTDPEKRRQRDEKGEMPMDASRKSLLERKKELEKERDELFEHKNDYKYIRQSVFLLDQPLQRMLLGILNDDDKAGTTFNEDTYIMAGNFGFENYLLLNYGKRIKDIPPEEIRLYKKEYDDFAKSDKNRFSVELARKLFALSEHINSSFAKPLNEAEAQLKDAVKNDTFLREIMLGNTEIFRQYITAKYNIPVFEQKIKDTTKEIDSLEEEIAKIDPDAATDEQKKQLEDFKEKLAELRANVASWDSAIENDRRSIAEFEVIYGDDPRKMVFDNIALQKNDDRTFKVDDKGVIDTTTISKEQRVLAKSILGLSEELNEILTKIHDFNYMAESATDELGVTNEEQKRAGFEGLANTNKQHTLFMQRIQNAAKIVKDYYKRIKDNHEMNTSDLYFNAFMNQLSNLFNSELTYDLFKTEIAGKTILSNLYTDNGKVYEIGPEGSKGAFDSLISKIKIAIKDKNYSALSKAQDDFITKANAFGINADDAKKMLDDMFNITIGFNPIDFVEEINNLRKDAKSYDIVDVIKSLQLSMDGNVEQLLDLLQEEKNAIITRGASLDDYIMEPDAKETLKRTKSLLLLAQAAIQAAYDGSNATSNAHIHDSSVEKYAEITENTVSRLMEDLLYYQNLIGFLLNLTEQNEKARSGYYQKCETNIHRNIIKQLTENKDKQTSWANLFYSTFGVDVPELFNQVLGEVGCEVRLDTLNKGNYKEFKPAFVRLFSELRSKILGSEEFKKAKSDEKFNDKSDEYVIGQLIGEFIKDKNPKLGDYGTIDADNPLTDLSMAVYLSALLNEDYESWFKSYISAVRSQDKYAPFAAQEVAILTQYQFAIAEQNENNALNGLLDVIEESNVDLTNVDVGSKNKNDKDNIQSIWNARQTLKNIFFTQGGTGSGKTSATAYFSYLMLKQKYGDDMEAIVVGPDITQSTAFKEILGLDDDHAFDLTTFIKAVYSGKEEISGLLNLNSESEETKKFCDFKDYDFKLKDSIGTNNDIKALFKNDKKHKFIFVDEATYINVPSLKLLQQYAEKHGIKILAYGDKTQNGAKVAFKKDDKIVYSDYNIADVFTLSSPSLGDSVRFENSAKDKNYRTIRATLSLIEENMRIHAVNLDEMARAVSEEYKNKAPKTKFEYFEDDSRFVGEKFITEAEVKGYIDKFKKLSADLHEGKSNICIITDDTTKYTAEEGVKVLNPRQVQGLEFDYVIIADHKFDPDFFTSMKDLYTLIGRSKKGTVIASPESKFKIVNESGNDSLTAPRNSTEEIKQFKDWKNEVLNEVESKLGAAPESTNPTANPGSNPEGGTTNPPAGKTTIIDPETGEEKIIDPEEDDDDSEDTEKKKEIAGYTAAKPIEQTQIDENKQAIEEEKKEIGVENKYSWNEFVDWVKDENGLFVQEGWSKDKFTNKYSIFNGVQVANSDVALKTNLQKVYRKLASAFVYGAKLTINQKDAILQLCPSSYRSIVEAVINEWNKGESGSGRFVARSDIKANKSLISLAVNITVNGTSSIKLIPVAIVDGQLDGSIKVGTDIFEKQSEADIFKTEDGRKIKVFNQENEIGIVSRSKILTKAAPKNIVTDADKFIKEATGKALSIVTDAEFLTNEDIDDIFEVYEDSNKYSKAFNYNEMRDESKERKGPTRYYISIGGTKVPIMNIEVDNMVSLSTLYDLACIGRYASGSAHWGDLTQRQRDLINTEMSGEDNENNKTNAAIKYMKQYMGEFQVKKDTNSTAGSRAQNMRIFKKLSNDYKLLSRGDTYWFVGSLWSAINNIDLDETTKEKLRIAFQKNMVYWMCNQETSSGDYYYKNSAILKFSPPYCRDQRYLLTYERNETTKRYNINIQRIAWNQYGPGKVGESIRVAEGINWWEVNIPKIVATCMEDVKKNTTPRSIADAEKQKERQEKYDAFFANIKNAAEKITSDKDSDKYLAKLVTDLCANGQIQVQLTKTRQKKDKNDPKIRSEKQVSFINDYQLISNIMDCIPDVPGAMDALVKSLAKAGHFKTGFILNNNRNITNDNEKRRLEKGYANMPHLPELTVSNFAGVKGSIWSVKDGVFDGTKVEDFGEFKAGQVNVIEEHGFKLGSNYKFENNVLSSTSGRFQITPEFANEIAEGVPNVKLLSVKSINFNTRTITFVHGISTTTCKLKDGVDIEFVTNGQLKSEEKPGPEPENKPKKVTYNTIQDYDGNVIEIPSNFKDTHEIIISGEKVQVYGITLNNDIVVLKNNAFRIIKLDGNKVFVNNGLFEVSEYNSGLIVGNNNEAYAIVNGGVRKGIFDKINKNVKFDDGSEARPGPTIFARSFGKSLVIKPGVKLILNDIYRKGDFYNRIALNGKTLKDSDNYTLVSCEETNSFPAFKYVVKDHFNNYYTIESDIDLTEAMYRMMTDDFAKYVRKQVKQVYPEMSDDAVDSIVSYSIRFMFEGNQDSFERINAYDPNIKVSVNEYGELIFERVQPDTTGVDIETIKTQYPDVTILEVDGKPVSEELEYVADTKSGNLKVVDVMDGEVPKTAVVVDGKVTLVPKLSELKERLNNITDTLSQALESRLSEGKDLTNKTVVADVENKKNIVLGWFSKEIGSKLNSVVNNPFNLGYSKFNEFVEMIIKAPNDVKSILIKDLKINSEFKNIKSALREYYDTVAGKKQC